MLQLQKAERKKAKLRIGFSGPSGSGKTFSALQLARGIATAWNKIAIIDTENGSGEIYSHLGDYNVITLTDFSPERYIEAIEVCENAGMEVIIIDSITHEWKYLLEYVERISDASKSKNSYTAWAKATPKHDEFIQKILQSKAHIFTTVRSKQDYSMDKDEKGKTVITKVGMKQETREGFEYELTISFDLNMNNIATASKDRTSIFSSDVGIKISQETGKKIREWNESGVDWEKLQEEKRKEEEKKKKEEEEKEMIEHTKKYEQILGELQSQKFIDDMAAVWNKYSEDICKLPQSLRDDITEIKNAIKEQMQAAKLQNNPETAGK